VNVADAKSVQFRVSDAWEGQKGDEKQVKAKKKVRVSFLAPQKNFEIYL
jgi:hypothetical protein